jgi:phosphatidylinositol glycan class O
VSSDKTPLTSRNEPEQASTEAQTSHLASLTWTATFSRFSLAVILLFLITIFHAVGLYSFTHGFLLTRLTIPNVSPAYNGEPPVQPTHSKAVILVIDALRTDFLTHDRPDPSPHHHGILSLPSELSARHPSHSLIFNAFSDPPTSSMQRLKAITTGSLPTFIDAGSNFASTAIEEDSIISQMVAANKTIAFMGDDTWVSLYPDSFTHSHPYDSFNVEDLHTVDNGVIEHLHPYLQQGNWDVLIGHFLGVDHVGHRVGPNGDTMKDKLQQMDSVLRTVVDMLDEDTLLVVLGDHGMDDKGNHGGDSELETAAGLWLYSKGAPLSAGNAGLERYTFPGMSSSVRHINQIDLVPTLSLLLGLPIPFNNLGSIIPEVFADRLPAMRENAQQLHRYLDEYNDPRINAYLASAWKATDADTYDAYRTYTQDALQQLRGLWAQFSITYIVAGLAILGLNIIVLAMLYNGIRNRGPNWPALVRVWIETCVKVGGITFAVLTVALAPFQLQNPGWLFPTVAIVSVLLVQILLAVSYLVSPSTTKLAIDVRRWIGPAIMIIHAASFASNSFIMWEDRMCLYLVNTVMLVYLAKSAVHPTADMRLKTIGLSLAFGAVTRVMSLFTVCREEQQPYCSVTFYDGLQPVAPKWALFAIIPLGLQLPRLIGLTFNRSKSLGGPARLFIGALWRIVLVLNAADWLLEALFALGAFQPAIEGYIRLLRTAIARASFVGSLLVMPYYFFTSGLCITVERGVEQDGSEKPVTVFGFANVYGTTYILFVLIAFGLFHQTSAPVAQVALAGMLIAILGHVENVDTNRDAVLMQQTFAAGNAGAYDGQTGTAIVRPNFTDVVPLVLLGFVGFFSTGHQAVFTTLQWKSAFVGFSSVTWPFSPILVILNTWGAFILSALAVPLLALWNISPRPQGNVPILAHTLQLAIAFIMYHTAVTFASALCSAWLRRHLMVWKVFAPRFMLAGVTLILVDLAMLLAVGIGMRWTAWKVSRTFRCESI